MDSSNSLIIFMRIFILLLLCSASALAQYPYLVTPTNPPVNGYIPQRTGAHNKWVPLSGGSQLWGTNTPDGGITNINSAFGSVNVGGTNAVILSDSLTTGNPLFVGRTNGTSSLMFRPDGSLFAGKYFGLDGGASDYSKIFLPKVVSITDSNGPLSEHALWLVVNNEDDFDSFGSLQFTVGQGTGVDMTLLNAGAYGRRVLNFQAAEGSTAISWATNSVTRFELEESGDLGVIKGVSYSWPSAHGAANSVLTDTDGAGTLSWSPLSNFWVTNTAEGGIKYVNGNSANAVAKLSPNGSGNFEVGYTNGGNLLSDGRGSFAIGASYSGVIQADGDGAFAGGETDFSGTILASEIGTFAFGQSKNSGSVIQSTLPGAFAAGDAETGGTIEAINYGAVALGNANTSGKITSSGNGSLAIGETTINGSALITATGAGSIASGDAEGGAIRASTTGSLASGKVESGGLLDAGDHAGGGQHVAAHVFGYSSGTNGMLIARSDGGFVTGYAESGAVITAGNTLSGSPTFYENVANFAGGFASGSTSKIMSVELAALAYGVSTNGGWLTSTGVCAVTFGQNIGNESGGGYSFAYGKNYTNRTAKTFNIGWSQYPASIQSEGAFQLATNALSNWPTSAATPGGCAFVNSNATVYLITSAPGSTTWGTTNKLAGP